MNRSEQSATRYLRAKQSALTCISLAVTAIALVLLIGYIVRSVDEAYTLEFVFEDGFTGKFKIIDQVRDGQPPEVHGKKVTYHIPKSGVLRLRGDDPGTGVSVGTVLARYRSGLPRIFADYNDPAKKGEFTIRWGERYVNDAGTERAERGSTFYLERR